MHSPSSTGDREEPISIWIDVEEATRIRHEEGSNLRIAMVFYNVGGGTVESLTKDWELTPEESAELMRLVKQGWAFGIWKDRRVFVDRRKDS